MRKVVSMYKSSLFCHGGWGVEKLCILFLVITCIFSACTPQAETTLPAEATVPPTSPPKPTETPPPASTATSSEPTLTPVTVPLELSQPGPLFTGKRTFTFADPARDDREVKVTIYYPAIKPEGYKGTMASNGEPDLSGAPYPVILSGGRTGGAFAAHMVSYGFVMIGVDSTGSYEGWDFWLVDLPMDMVFALDQVASRPLEGLDGMIDASRAGAMGYSSDGYDALAVSGARIDPQYYLEKCAGAASMDPALPEWWIEYICGPSQKWDAFAERAGESITTSEDILWQPITDDRILAVMPMGPEGAWLFGERGLAAVNRPVLIIAAGEDEINYYDLEAVPIFEQLGTPDKGMVTFIGKTHMMVFDDNPFADMRHFAAAFFGYHLQGKTEYARYFSEEYLAAYPRFAWGVYTR